jgi:hypothetical protein
VCVWSLRYAACKACAPYFYLWPFRLCNFFPRHLIEGTIFWKKFIEGKMCVLNYSTTFVWNISYFEKNSAWCYHKCKLVFMSSTRYSLSDVNETRIFLRGFSKNTQIKSLWKSVQWEPSFSMRTERNDEVNSILRNFATAPTNGIIFQVV